MNAVFEFYERKTQCVAKRFDLMFLLEERSSPDQAEVPHCIQIVSLLNTRHAIILRAFDQKSPSMERRSAGSEKEGEDERRRRVIYRGKEYRIQMCSRTR